MTSSFSDLLPGSRTPLEVGLVNSGTKHVRSPRLQDLKLGTSRPLTPAGTDEVRLRELNLANRQALLQDMGLGDLEHLLPLTLTLWELRNLMPGTAAGFHKIVSLALGRQDWGGLVETETDTHGWYLVEVQDPLAYGPSISFDNLQVILEVAQKWFPAHSLLFRVVRRTTGVGTGLPQMRDQRMQQMDGSLLDDSCLDWHSGTWHPSLRLLVQQTQVVGMEPTYLRLGGRHAHRPLPTTPSAFMAATMPEQRLTSPWTWDWPVRSWVGWWDRLVRFPSSPNDG